MNQQQFDQFVAETCDVAAVDPQRPLVDLGVDSMRHLSLVMALEDRYGVEIDPDALADEQLSTSAGLRAYVESLAA